METTSSWYEKQWQEGKIEGDREARQEVARKMLQKGYPTEEIIDYTDLSESEIRELMDNDPA